MSWITNPFSTTPKSNAPGSTYTTSNTGTYNTMRDQEIAEYEKLINQERALNGYNSNVVIKPQRTPSIDPVAGMAHPVASLPLPDMVAYWQAKFGYGPVEVRTDALDVWLIYDALVKYDYFRTLPFAGVTRGGCVVVLRSEEERAFVKAHANR